MTLTLMTITIVIILNNTYICQASCRHSIDFFLASTINKPYSQNFQIVILRG